MCDPPFIHRTFWRLWTAAGLSSLADGVLKVALPLVAVGYTREPALVAGLAFAFSVPWLLSRCPPARSSTGSTAAARCSAPPSCAGRSSPSSRC
ncbi:hypothetical protein [Amycolatopsis sp. NPDC049159]|uniref:hypothetical protein n=1 Tax=Amycolatopsis sp. NPDC049159 TaxID=3157210 RepID=UPI00340097B7